MLRPSMIGPSIWLLDQDIYLFYGIHCALYIRLKQFLKVERSSITRKLEALRPSSNCESLTFTQLRDQAAYTSFRTPSPSTKLLNMVFKTKSSGGESSMKIDLKQTSSDKKTAIKQPVLRLKYNVQCSNCDDLVKLGEKCRSCGTQKWLPLVLQIRWSLHEIWSRHGVMMIVALQINCHKTTSS